VTIIRPNLGAHVGKAHNSLTFSKAYAFAAANPATIYKTTGNLTPFTVRATVRGPTSKHQGEKVLRFMSRKRERACAYKGCWGFKTNCEKTHIDCYTEAM
jgi:hypothetical protein